MNLSSARNTLERWAHHSQSQLLPLKMFAPESDHACSVLDSRGQCVSVKKSVSWFWPEQNKDKTKTKHRLGHKGASYLSTLLDTKLIYTNWSTNINLCLWSVSALLHNEDTSVLSVAAVFFTSFECTFQWTMAPVLNRTGRADDQINVCLLGVFASCCDRKVELSLLELDWYPYI